MRALRLVLGPLAFCAACKGAGSAGEPSPPAEGDAGVSAAAPADAADGPGRASDAGPGALRVVGLRCEYLVDPLGIDTPRPRLSWALESDGRDQKQTAYQIVVASDGRVAWDTGKVASGQQLHVPYGGRALASGERLTWTVRAWDRDDRASAPSAPASFEMALLSPGDWKGKWLGGSTALVDPPAPAPLLRTTFTVARPVRSARVHVAGVGYHELHLNGAKVGDQVLAAGYTRFDRRVLYVTYDVTAAVRVGKNALGVVLGNGFLNQTIANDWQFHSAPWRATPRALVQAQITFADGSTQTVVSDESWKVSTGPILYDQVRSGETYDARLEKAGWDAPELVEDASWTPALVVPAPKGVLSAQMFAPSKVTQTLPAKALTEPKPGLYVFDFGQNLAGWARLTVSAPAGTMVTLRYGERLAKDGSVDQSAIQGAVKGRFQRDVYIAKGQGTETWEPRFEYNGFQYVEVAGLPARPAMDAVAARVVHTAFEPVGQWSSSSDLLDRIFEATRWSYRSNFQSVPTDCPHREKNGWMADAHLAAEQAMFTYDNAAGYTKWIRDIADEMRPTGELPGIVPSGGWGYDWGNGPAWDSALFVIPWYMYLYDGDRQLLTDNYDKLQRYVDYVGTRNYVDKNPGGWLGDWIAPGDKTPEAVTHAGYHAFDARVLSTVATWLGKADDAKKYADVAAQVKATFRQRYFDATTGQVATGSQTALATALYQDLVDGADRDKVLAALVAKIAAKRNHLDAGCLGTKYLPWALTDGGRADLFYAMATQKDYPGWGQWLARGATTLWEDWGGSASLNHIFLGDVVAWMFRALAGINPDPDGPGFEKIIIRPQVVGDLTFARAETRALRGRIASDWKLDGGDLVLNVIIPAGSTATVFVPASRREDVTADGGTFLRGEGARQVFAIGSGTYRFTVKGGPPKP